MLLFQQLHYLGNIPHMIRNARFHCRGYAECLMNPNEVVEREVECQRVAMVLDLL